MNEFEERFRKNILKNVSCIKEIFCVNFNEEGQDEFVSGEDNAYIVILLEKKYKNIRIEHNLFGDIGGLRFKMYYANQPENAFDEYRSCELGFFDNTTFEKTICLGGQGYDAFRFDFGFRPIKFRIRDFKLDEVTDQELRQQEQRDRNDNIKKNIKFIMNSLWHWKLTLRKIKNNGIKHEIVMVRQKLRRNTKMDINAKVTRQITEPYQVVVKEPIESDRKRVLNIIENFYTGGSSRLIIDNIEYYGHKYEHKILTMAYHGEEEFLDIDVEVIDIENRSEVIRKIREFVPDIIHVHIWEGEWYHKVFDVLEDVKDVKIIENINTPVKPIIKDFIDMYVFVSQYVVDNFAKQDELRRCVIYPGSNFEMFTRELKDSYLARDTIGMVYRLGYDKLNQHSIDVFIKTVQKRPKTKAIIVGGGPQYDYYVDKVTQAGVSSNFLFTGYVPYVDLPKWYEKFTIFVAPVWQESFGQVSPFAMSMGIPVAGYHIGALNEIIANTSLLAEPDNSEELADVLVELLDDYDKCVEIGKYNQKRAHELFGVRKMVDDYFELYNNL